MPGRGAAAAGGRTVVVGDTVHDVQGALDTGARAVGVATGRVGAGTLAEAGAHAVLPDLTDAGALVDAVRSGAVGPLTVTTLGGEPVHGSPHAAAFEAAGFGITPKGVRIRR